MTDSVIGSIGTAVEQELARWHVPGMAVGVFRDGTSEARGFGVASLETRQPVTTATVFRVASISKVFTATLAVALAEDGRLDLDRPVGDYLPDLKLADAASARALTVRLLLSHQSGLWGDFSPDCGLGEDAMARAVGRFGTLRQLTAPRETWAYCNTGFHLTGHLIERVMERPFENVMRDRILDPIGMPRTGYFWHDVATFPIAVGYNQREPGGDEHVPSPQYYPRNRNAAGGVITTVPDLLRFAQMHLDEGTIDGRRVLKPESVRAMQEPQTAAGNFADHWGIGWDIRDRGGVTLVGHGGSINGYQSRLTLIPDRRFALVTLTNSARGSAAYRGVEAAILDRELGAAPPEPTHATPPAAELQRLSGVYRQPLSRFEVTVEGNGLLVDVSSRHPSTGRFVPFPPLRLAPIGGRRFVVVGGETDGSRVEFLGDAGGGTPRWIRVGGRLAERAEDGATEPPVWV